MVGERRKGGASRGLTARGALGWVGVRGVDLDGDSSVVVDPCHGVQTVKRI